jgi:hypothetical protein
MGPGMLLSILKTQKSTNFCCSCKQGFYIGLLGCILVLLRVLLLLEVLGEEVLADHVVAAGDDHPAEEAGEGVAVVLDRVAFDEAVEAVQKLVVLHHVCHDVLALVVEVAGYSGIGSNKFDL